MRKLKTDKIDLDKVTNLTKEQAKSRYNVGDVKLRAIADDAGAVIRIGKKILYSRTKMDRYFEHMAE